MRIRAFTLVELLVVIGILAVLAAILLPVLAQVRGKGRQTACLSNLRQIGMANQMYATDNDDFPVWGGDPPDLYSGGWGPNPDVLAFRPQHEVLMPYIKSRALWRCPSDYGFERCGPFNGTVLSAHPSAYGQYGSSYITRTEIILLKRPISSIEGVTVAQQTVGPAGIGLFFDATDSWHGGRVNAAYLDGHAKSLGVDDYHGLWMLRIK